MAAGEYTGQPVHQDDASELLCIETTTASHHSDNDTMQCTGYVLSSTASYTSSHEPAECPRPLKEWWRVCLAAGWMLCSQYARGCLQCTRTAMQTNFTSVAATTPVRMGWGDPSVHANRTGKQRSASAAKLEAGTAKQTSGGRWRPGNPCIATLFCSHMQ
jgi:hypothetical protein